jgi:hypothetical protein
MLLVSHVTETVSTTKTSPLMPQRKMIAVYSENPETLKYTVYPSIHPSIHPLLDLGHFFSFLIYMQAVGLLGQGMSPSQARYQRTEQHKHRINVHRHPYLEWHSNPPLDRAATVIST